VEITAKNGAGHEKGKNKLQIRNSTAEFLIFTRQAGEDGIEVRVVEETVWLTQKLMAALFEVTIPTINEHLSNLYSQGEIVKGATIRNFRTVQKEGGREVVRNVDFYNLAAIIAVGFRVNSGRAIQFRQWATVVLRDYAIRGYVLDKERLITAPSSARSISSHWASYRASHRASPATVGVCNGVSEL
jgi:hypothetical protein